MAADVDLLMFRDHEGVHDRVSWPTEDAQALPPLHGHRPIALYDLSASFHEYRHRDWLATATTSDLADLLAYEATGVAWRALETVHAEHDIPHAELRQFTLRVGGELANTCFRANLSRDELLRILAAPDTTAVAAVVDVETVEFLAAMNDPHQYLLGN